MTSPSPKAPAVQPNPEDKSGNARIDARSNVFVMAALYAATSSAPVRIRNMSRGGAQVEGGALPHEGQEIQLCRGSLSVTGRVVWRDHSRAGLRFDSPIAVADWLPQGSRSCGQQRIDDIVFESKSQRAEGPAAAGTEAATDGQAGVAAQLKQFSQSLDRIAGELAEDVAVTSRFQTQLQALDLIAQALARLAIVTASPQPRRD